MNKRQQLLVGIGMVLGILVIGVQRNRTSEQNQVFKLAEVNGADYPTSVANQKFADLVKEKTAGKIQIEIETDGKLGEETEVIKEIQNGGIAFGRISIGPLAEYVDILHSLMLPYLYEDSDHMWRVLESKVGTQMLDAIARTGLTGLAWYEGGARNFYSKEKIEQIEDLQNKKIRVQKNSLMYAMCEAIGAVPQSVAEGDIYRLILEGSLDGAENNIPTYETYGQYEVCNYYILDEHTRIPELLVVSNEVLNHLSLEQQQIIKEAAAEAGAYERVLWQEREQEAIARLEEQGVQFIKLSEEVKAYLRKACESLYKEFGGNYEGIIEEIKAMAKS